MRAVRYHDHGGAAVLTVDNIDAPEPGPGELRIAVRAAAVNPVDTYFREGAYPVPELPMIPGSDAAGVVDAVGPGVESFAEGDRVFATGLGNGRQGSYAEQAIAPAEFCASLPEAVTFGEGAAVALVGVTAWQAFVAHAGVEPGERVLVHAGSGGVGHVAVQLASAMGAEVTTTARPEYAGHLTTLGADDVIDYRQDEADLAAAIADAGAPDAVLDTHADSYLGLDCEVAAHGGRIVLIGNESPEATLPVGTGKSKELQVQVMSMYNTPDIGAVLDRLATLMTRGNLAPDIAGRYSFEEAGEAQRAVLEESFLGKLLVVPDA
jgi:NADPH:quinone reductase-like Zn-dependent oxidoreductase